MERVCGRLREVVTFKNRSTGGPFLVTRLQGVKTTENHKTASPTTFRETTLQLCSESISLSAAKLRIAKRPYSGGALILPRSLHRCSVLWVFKATLSFTEKGEVKTRIWGHTWGSKTRNLPYSERIKIRKNDTDRDGVIFSIFLQWPIYLINSVDKTKSLLKKKDTKTSAFHWRDANLLNRYWESAKVDCKSKRIQQDSFLDLLHCKHVSLTCITALARFSLDHGRCSSINNSPHNVKVSWLINYGKLDTCSMFSTSLICEVWNLQYSRNRFITLGSASYTWFYTYLFADLDLDATVLLKHAKPHRLLALILTVSK